MGKAISPKQMLQLASVLMNNADLDVVSSETAQALIDSPAEAGRQFTAFLKNGGRMQLVVKDFPVWRKLKLGTGLKTADDFRAAIKTAGMNIGDYGNDILGKPAFMVSPDEVEVELVNVSVAELGFKDGATRADIYKRASELGLELCPNEVGPQLRLQYTDQPNGEWLLVAMEPITDSDRDLNVFLVERNGDGEQWLRGDRGRPGDFWNGDDRWVFLRRKVSA